MRNDGKSDGEVKNNFKNSTGKLTRRGLGKGKRINDLKFSILGSNANGIRGKIDSLKNAVKFFNNPSCITIQESKLRGCSLKLPGYQLFLKNRKGFGGGLVTAVDENLPSVQVSTSENDIFFIQTKVGDHKIRIINGYGPQKLQNEKEKQLVFDFWQDIEKQVISAIDDDCQILMQLDANGK